MVQFKDHAKLAGNKVTPFTEDVKLLTGKWGTLEQFVRDYLSDFDWFIYSLLLA